MTATSTGHLILLMAPSGSGKKKMLESIEHLTEKIYFAKTYTSRPPREGTEENPKYQFVSREEFQDLIDNEALIEWAEFSGNYYGTPTTEFTEPLAAGKVVMKEMELQGVQQIRQLIPAEQCTVIYIDAGSWEDLKGRILSRAPMDEEHLAMRRARYEEESSFKPSADVVIENHNGKLEAAQEHFCRVVEDILSTYSERV
jgi:guanylate kinase